VALFSLISAHIGLANRWIATQELPTGTRDEFFVVAETFDIAWQLQNLPLSQLGVYPLLIAKSYYPPLCRLPGVAALLSGGDYDAMIMAQWWWVPILAVATFVAARTVLSSWGSVAAVALLLAAPGVHDTFHRYEPNLGSMAMAACVLAAWLHSRNLRNVRASLLAGLFLGMGMLTDRLGVLPFVLVPLVVSVTRSTAKRESLKGLAVLTLAVLAVAGWWYFDFFARFADELLPQFLGGEISADGSELEHRPPFMLWWSHYLVLWPDSQLGLVGGSLALIGLGWMMTRRAEPAACSILWWLIPGLVLFSLIQKRQPFYTLGLLPAASICAALVLEELSRKLPRGGLSVAVVLIAMASTPAVITSNAEIDVPPGIRDWLLNSRSPLPEHWIGERFPLGVPPQDVGLRLSDTLQVLRDNGLGDDELVLVFSDDGIVNESALWSFGRIDRSNQQVLGLTLDPQAILEQGKGAAALIFVHDTPGSWPQERNLKGAHERFFGFDVEYQPLLPLVAGLRDGATLVEERRLKTEATLSSWLLKGQKQ
jgi:fucose 4-O-acetylase-like acetyltransferase